MNQFITLETPEFYKSFFDNIDIKIYRSILCLNGELPSYGFFNKINLPIIAADGAANYLLENNLMPEAIIGDLDSLDLKKFKNFQESKLAQPIKLIQDGNQAFSDFQKAIIYIKENNLSPSIILGVSGGYIDHILNNINIFCELEGIFFAPPIMGYIIKAKEYKELALPVNTKISLLGAPAARITTTGLKWELEDSLLSFFGINSCFNRILKEKAMVRVHEGSVLVLIYLQDINDAGK